MRRDEKGREEVGQGTGKGDRIDLQKAEGKSVGG